MKIGPYIQKLESSKEYKEFQGKYKDHFLVAGFFVLDFENGANVHQIDYFVPKAKKVAAFTLDNKVVLQMMETMSKKTPAKLDSNIKIDLDTLQGIVEDEMKNRGISEKIKKMIAVVQNIEGKKVWNVNCILSGMDLLRSHVDDASKTVLKMEKNSMMDYIKKMPALPNQQGQQKPASKEDIAAKIKQLDKIKEDLKKQEVESETAEKAKK